MIEIEQRTIETGLPVVSLQMPGTRAVTVLVAFDAGARTERAEENGMAHFLEHLVFKGGEKYATYRDVNNTAERLGAQLNAYTSHDIVAFHITCRAEAINEAVDLLSDFVGRAHIDAEELDRERGVVIQEINRSDDVPSSVADKLLDRAIYGEHPLGRAVLGPAEHLRTFSRDAIVAFRERQWATERGGAFLAGDVSHADAAKVDELLARFPARPANGAADPAPQFERRILVTEKDTNQSHLRLAWKPKVDPASIEQRAALSRLLDAARRLDGLAPVRRDPRAARPLLLDPLLRLDALRRRAARGLERARLDEVPRGLRPDQGDRDRAARAGPDRGGGRAGARLRRRVDRPRARVDERGRARARPRTRSPTARSSRPRP